METNENLQKVLSVNVFVEKNRFLSKLRKKSYSPLDNTKSFVYLCYEIIRMTISI